LNVIPYGRQTIDAEDIQAVVDVLHSDFLTQGPAVPRFERVLAEHCGAPHAIAVNSATSALHIACLALGVGPGDRVWTSPNTFVASANCARYCGATVDFVDIDPETYNMCTHGLAVKLAQAQATNTLPKVVIPVHFAGLPCDMEEIGNLSHRYGFKIIEDASHAIGARYSATVIGDCQFSDIAVFSFHPVKIITTAEGGLATTRSAELAHKMRLLRTHGISRDSADLVRTDEGPWYYEQHFLGFNYRMTEMQAALGLSQLKHLDSWIARRHAIADCYDAGLADLPLILPRRPFGSRSSLHLYVVQIDHDRTQLTRREVFGRLRAAGVGVNVHYIPVHTQPYFCDLGFRAGQFPVSESYYSRCISIPMFAGLTDSDQALVIRALHEAMS
jgi:UDP-4-amino-4,6-dideoxy-N-acetyl-beta-L-altrosamine transaminase